MSTHILITGASRGIGAAIADALTTDATKVVALSSADGDLSDPATPDRLWQASLDKLDGRIDVLVHRSEERRVGKECVSTCSSRWTSDNSKKKYVSLINLS